MLHDINKGDAIKLYGYSEIDFLRGNDRDAKEINRVFLCKTSYVIDINIDADYIDIARYSGEDCQRNCDNYFIVRTYDPTYTLIERKSKNPQSVHYDDELWALIEETKDYVYLLHYSVFKEGEKALKRFDKKHFYENAVFVDEFPIIREWFKKEWLSKYNEQT